MKAILYAHGGSGNHGCEAIARSTANILGGLFEVPPTLVSDRADEDAFYGLGDIFRLVNSTGPIKKTGLAFTKAYLELKLKKSPCGMDALFYRPGTAIAEKGDIALSIGGDNYCCKDLQRYVMLHGEYKKRGAKTVLWGCSLEPELLNDREIADDIASYDLITARESVSYDALAEVNPRTVRTVDPAFTLKAAPAELPEGFKRGNTVGINISPLVIAKEKTAGAAFANYEKLCEYILRETDMAIALIPHVVWRGNDDRTPLKELYRRFADSGRVCLAGDAGCEKLKGVIAACRFFVAARTHASIAAYSSCVPTLVVGYSVKSRGIARDIFGSEDGRVLPVQRLSEPSQLARAFARTLEGEERDRLHLQKTMVLYAPRARAAAEEIKKLQRRAV